MIEVSNKVAYTNPFPGLRSFEPEDAYLFFGRDHQISDLKEKLTQSRFLAVVGSSGSGKSSLVKAGLVAEFIDNTVLFSTAKNWQVAYFSPEATPLRNLARALYQTLSSHNRAFGAQVSPEQVETALLTDADAVISWLQDVNLLLVIDQFEELFRYQLLQDGREEVTRFIDLLLDLSRRAEPLVYIVVTMRSDYLDECTNYDGLTEAINHGSYLLPKMHQNEIRQAITAPVRVMGADISDELVDRLLGDIGPRTDQLPILQHALMRTWNYWQLNRKSGENKLEIRDYEAIGTMASAISIHAEEVYGDLPDEKSRLAAEKLFKALVVLGKDNTSTIQPTSVATISEVSGINAYQLIDVLDRFREPGVAFLTPLASIPADSDLIIDLSHESILKLWERLQTWVRDETESATLYRQVSQSARLYHEGKTGLWSNPELQIGLKWLAENRPTQAWANRYDPYLERAVNFLTYSQSQYAFEVQTREDQQRKELKRARFFAVFLGIGALISFLFLIVSAVLRTQAQQSEDEAIAEKQIALAERGRAERQTREAITQKKIAEQQEIIAEQQRRLTEEQRSIAVREQQVANEKRREAEVAQQMAIAQRQRAERALTEAQLQRSRADLARQEAERQKVRADGARQDAESQRQRAVTAQQYAEQQRGKAIARTLAIQSFQMTDNNQDDLPTLLALTAYNLNAKNGGRSDNPDIFNALAKATNAQTVLRRHTDVVRTLAVSAGKDGRWIASGSDDGTVKLWSATNPSQAPLSLLTSKRSVDGIRSVAFGSDGQTVFGGSEKGVLYRWNVAQPEAQPATIKAHNGPIQILLTTPDQRQLVSVSGDGQIRTFAPNAVGLDSLQNVHSGQPILSARLTPDGRQLLCGSTNGRVLAFNMTNLKQTPAVFTRREFGSRITALAISPDGNRLITGNSVGQVFAWQLVNGEPVAYGTLLSGRHTSTVSDIAFSPDGKLLATGSADWTIHIWDYASLSQQQQPIVITDFDAWVMSVRFSDDSKHLIAAGADKTVRVRTVDTNALFAELKRRVKRNLTAEEWEKYVGKDIPYEATKLD